MDSLAVDESIEEQQLAAMFSLSLVGMAEIELPSGRYRRVNRRFCELTGRAEEELLRLTVRELTHPEDRERDAEGIAALIRGDVTEHRIEKRYLRPDGTPVWAAVSATLVRNAHGRIVGSVGVIHDISALKRQQELLRESEERLRASQNQLQLITDALPVLISYVDAGQRYRFVNKAYQETFATEDYYGKHVRDVIGPEMYETARPHIERALAGESFRAEMRIRWNGEMRDIAVTYVPHRDGDRVVGYVALTEDITERKRVEETLREQAQTLETLNRIGRVLSAELDLQRLVQALTDAGTEICHAAFGAYFHNEPDPSGQGFRMYTLSGAPRETFTGFPLVRAAGVLAETLMKAAIVRSDDITHDPRFGRNGPYEGMPRGHLPVRSYLAVPVVSRTGEVLGGLIFGHPEPGVFTERAERLMAGIASQAAIAIDNARLYAAAQQEIAERKRAEEALRFADRRKDEFLATLAHELRNPLAPIRTSVQLLKAPGLDESRRQWSRDVIDRQVRHMARLLDDLLDVSRITRGRLELRKQLVAVHTAVEAAVETARPLIDARQHTIELDLPPRPLMVEADPDRLVQIVANLLNNAAKYTDAGGRLRIAVSVENGEAVIRVQDNGVGITREMLARIFEMFTQGPGSAGRSEGGLGVGLAITRGLVELHGGRIEAHSDGPGRGSEFVVRLPGAREEGVAEGGSV